MKRQKLGETRKRGKPKENHLHNGFLPKKKNQQELRKILISKTSSAKKIFLFQSKRHITLNHLIMQTSLSFTSFLKEN